MRIQGGVEGVHPQHLTQEELKAAGKVLSDHAGRRIVSLRIDGKPVEGELREEAVAAYRRSQHVASDGIARVVDRTARAGAELAHWIDRCVDGILDRVRGRHGAEGGGSGPGGAEEEPRGRLRTWAQERLEDARALMRTNPERVLIGADAEVTFEDGSTLTYCPLGVDKASSARNERLALLGEAGILAPVGTLVAVVTSVFSPSVAAAFLTLPLAETAVAGGLALAAKGASLVYELRGNHHEARAQRAMAKKYGLLGLLNWVGIGPVSVADGLSTIAFAKDSADLDALMQDERAAKLRAADRSGE